jgi:hypothetical protein
MDKSAILKIRYRTAGKVTEPVGGARWPPAAVSSHQKTIGLFPSGKRPIGKTENCERQTAN